MFWSRKGRLFREGALLRGLKRESAVFTYIIYLFIFSNLFIL